VHSVFIDAGFHNSTQNYELAARREQTMRVFLPLLLLSVSVHSTVAHALTPEELQIYERQYYELRYYKLKYPNEIFNYCVDKYGTIDKYETLSPALGGCMVRQKKLKDSIIGDAKIYDECVEYYPKNGVTRIGKCVQTRLVLRRKLQADSVEKEIYLKCDLKWRKHGAGAVDNCSRAQANYYRDNGQLEK
jgi:hypothetical protein